eukprot:CAMPEP_0197515630 /NCGR_PEP_ID=MMETSP1318-20131121/691_1 /TAXON_ID=552666 /ORGANISM="Partenskyella glossopodia, Strain RCC365" /LENGTH=90 /DNA_ID=CAMNT_0043064053 /DNA_START=699 /DNA_END=971 /DNA_ORIENTATION=+
MTFSNIGIKLHICRKNGASSAAAFVLQLAAAVVVAAAATAAAAAAEEVRIGLLQPGHLPRSGRGVAVGACGGVLAAAFGEHEFDAELAAV